MTLVGTLPPTKGISDTCLEQLRHLGPRVPYRFLGFAQLYPESIYPGGTRDETASTPELEGVEILRPMRWYDPTSWVRAGFLVTGEVCHFHWWTYVLFPPLFTVLLIARLRGKRIVANVHNVLGHESHVVDRWLSWLFLRSCHRLIVHSDRNAEQLVEAHGVPEKRIARIPLGTPDFLVAPVPRAEARAALGIDDDAPVVLGFGNIRKYKGVDVLLRAFAAVRAERPDARLVIAGRPWIDWAPYQAIVEEHDLTPALTLDLGYVPTDRVRWYFSAADVLVLPYTHFDAQSGPGRIALGYGLPMVASRVGGLPDLVGGDDRCLFDAGDVDGCVGRLRAMLGDRELRVELARAATARAEEFGWASVARRTLELYDEVTRAQ